MISQKRTISIKRTISNLTVSHILSLYGTDMEYANRLLSAIKLLLSDNISKYSFPARINKETLESMIPNDDFQNSLAKLNEKETRRKKEGVFYTDHDVTDFIASNTFLHYVCSSEKNVYGTNTINQRLDRLSIEQKNKIINATTIDPTCGTGEFLLSTLRIKIHIFLSLGLLQPSLILNTIYGNDIEPQSTDIAKLRVFFLLIDSIGRLEDPVLLAQIAKKNFTNVDAVDYNGTTFGDKDVFIGNPPYVEYRNFDGKTQFEYGNIYADVLHHSVKHLSKNGIMAFVVPMSYVSTIRMAKIRDYICLKTNKQIVMNFADRPDCLFSCVHQKLTIVIAQKRADYEGILSSSYNYWYHSERKQLFNGISLFKTNVENTAYWPKLGNEVEASIYNKFMQMRGNDMLNFPQGDSNKLLYVNQRGCFWMKVFARDMNSSSYAKYSIPSNVYPFVYCFLNSSLFFLLWIIISDGWHITNKELRFVKPPDIIENPQVWSKLMNELSDKLEETKVLVKTKQVDYEYKHKACKCIIDKIDKELSRVYHLSPTQLEYIKTFALKYRTSDEPKN